MYGFNALSSVTALSDAARGSISVLQTNIFSMQEEEPDVLLTDDLLNQYIRTIKNHGQYYVSQIKLKTEEETKTAVQFINSNSINNMTNISQLTLANKKFIKKLAAAIDSTAAFRLRQTWRRYKMIKFRTLLFASKKVSVYDQPIMLVEKDFGIRVERQINTSSPSSSPVASRKSIQIADSSSNAESVVKINPEKAKGYLALKCNQLVFIPPTSEVVASIHAVDGLENALWLFSSKNGRTKCIIRSDEYEIETMKLSPDFMHLALAENNLGTKLGRIRVFQSVEIANVEAEIFETLDRSIIVAHYTPDSLNLVSIEIQAGDDPRSDKILIFVRNAVTFETISSTAINCNFVYDISVVNNTFMENVNISKRFSLNSKINKQTDRTLIAIAEQTISPWSNKISIYQLDELVRLTDFSNGTSNICKVNFTPNGEILAIAKISIEDRKCYVYLYESTTWTEVSNFTDGYNVKEIQFSVDNLLSLIAVDNKVVIRCLETYALIWSVQKDFEIDSAIWLNQTSWLLSKKEEVIITAFGTNQESPNIISMIRPEISASLSSAEHIKSDGSRRVAISSAKTSYDGSMVAIFDEYGLYICAVSDKFPKIATWQRTDELDEGDPNAVINIVDPRAAQQKRVLSQRGNDSFNSFPEFIYPSWSKNDSKIVAIEKSSTAPQIFVWGVSPLRVIQTFSKNGLQNYCTAPKFSPTNNIIAVGHLPNEVILLQVDNGTIFKKLKRQLAPTSLDFSPNGRKLVILDISGAIAVLDLERNTSKEVLFNSRFNQIPTQIHFSPRGWISSMIGNEIIYFDPRTCLPVEGLQLLCRDERNWKFSSYSLNGANCCAYVENDVELFCNVGAKNIQSEWYSCVLTQPYSEMVQIDYIQKAKQLIMVYNSQITQGGMFKHIDLTRFSQQPSFEDAHAIIMDGNVESTRRMIDRFPQVVNLRDGDGNTLIHILASKEEFVNSLDALLKSTCPIAFNCNNKGETALHIAVRNHFRHAIKLMLGCIVTHIQVNLHSTIERCIILIADIFPDLLLDFFKELKFYSVPLIVSEGVEYAALKSEGYLIVGASSKAPTHLWQNQIQKLEKSEGVPVEAKFIPLQNVVSFGNELSESLLHKITALDDSNYFDNPTLSAIVKFKWKKYGERYFKHRIIIYFIFAILFTIYSREIAKQDIHGFDSNSTTPRFTQSNSVYGLQIAVLLFDFYHIYIELTQARHDDFQEYLDDPWNYIDWLLYLAVILVVPLHEMRNRSVKAIAALANVLMWGNVLFYLRAFEKTGALVKMIIEISRGIGWFLFILAIILIGFACSFYVLLNGATDELGNKIPQYSSPGHSVASTIVMGFGIINKYVFKYAEFSSLAYLIFAAYLVVVSIILLNLIVSLVEEVYEQVKEKEYNEFLLERARIIVEIEQVHLTTEDKCNDDYFPRWLHVLQDKAFDPTQRGGASGVVDFVHKKIAQMQDRIGSIEERHDRTVELLVNFMSRLGISSQDENLYEFADEVEEEVKHDISFHDINTTIDTSIQKASQILNAHNKFDKSSEAKSPKESI